MTALTCQGDLLLLIVIRGWRSRWSTRPSGCRPGWAAVVLPFFFPFLKRQAMIAHWHKTNKAHQKKKKSHFSSVKRMLKVIAPILFSPTVRTWFDDPLEPAWLLWGRGRRRGRRVVVVPVRTLGCPVNREGQTGVPATQHQPVCVHLRTRSQFVVTKQQKQTSTVCLLGIGYLSTGSEHDGLVFIILQTEGKEQDRKDWNNSVKTLTGQ